MFTLFEQNDWVPGGERDPSYQLIYIEEDTKRIHQKLTRLTRDNISMELLHNQSSEEPLHNPAISTECPDHDS